MISVRILALALFLASVDVLGLEQSQASNGVSTVIIVAGTLSAILSMAQGQLESLSVQEHDSLVSDLQKWKASAVGQAAVAKGFAPRSSKLEAAAVGGNPDELKRFLDSKIAVARLQKQYPEAQFSLDHPFAMMTSAEFAAYVQSSVEKTNRYESAPANATNAARDLEALADDTVDWSSHKCIAPVRDQGKCGSCWAFAAVAVAEFAHCLNTGQRVDVSVQQVVSCDTGGNFGCKGGVTSSAMNYLSGTPVCLESSYPYTSGTSQSTGTCSMKRCSTNRLQVGRSVVGSGDQFLSSSVRQRPTVVNVYGGNDVWRHYKSGVVKACPSGRSDHSVLVVGMGTEQDGTQYYKIKNSWGANWGDRGYIKLQRGGRGTGTCNIVERCTYHANTRSSRGLTLEQ